MRPGTLIVCLSLIGSNTISAAMLCVAIAAAPFFFGSTAPAVVAFWCLWLGLALLLASPRLLKRQQSLLLLAVVCIAVAFVGILHEQLAATPWFATPSSVWSDAAVALGQQIRPVVTTVRGAPFYNAGPIVANLLALTLGLVVGSDRRWARHVLVVAMMSGLFYSVYGIYSFLVWPNYVLWQEKEFYVGELTSTFTFRNTAAVYLGSMAVVSLFFLLEAVRERLPRGRLRWQFIVTILVLERQTLTTLKLLAFFVGLAAVLMTHSRAGIVISLSAMLFACWLFFMRDLLGSSNRLFVGLSLCIGSLLVLQALSGAVADRIIREGLSDNMRLDTYKATLRMIGDYPWFGTGLGTFRWIFPTYRSDGASMWGVWDNAHSTPLELVSEMGIPFACLTAIAWIGALAVLVRGTLRRRRDKIIPQSALVVALIALAHSTIDFSLQIAGFSIVVFGLLGVGLAQSFGSTSARTARPAATEALSR